MDSSKNGLNKKRRCYMLDIIKHNLPTDLDTLMIYPINDLHVGENVLTRGRLRNLSR